MRIKRYTKVRVASFEGIIQNAIEMENAHVISIRVPSTKGTFWVLIPNDLIEVLPNE